MRLGVAFEAFVPVSRWGPLFQVLRLEHPELELDWQPASFPSRNRSLLETADVGLFIQPPAEPGLSALTIESSEMLVMMAVGHPLAQHPGVSVADILDQPFPGGPDLHPDWVAFWTLDECRGGPPRFTGAPVENAAQWLDAIASARAIGTVPAWLADSLPHPGVVALPLRGAPTVETRLVWRAENPNPMVRALVDLAAEMTSNSRDDSSAAVG